MSPNMAKAKSILGNVENVENWREMFPTTAGPFGSIGGQALTEFVIEAYFNKEGEYCVFANGELVPEAELATGRALSQTSRSIPEGSYICPCGNYLNINGDESSGSLSVDYPHLPKIICDKCGTCLSSWSNWSTECKL